MEERENTPKYRIIAILTFAVALFLCLVELDLLCTPIDGFLQRSSAVLGVLAKPLWAIWKWLV
jgi:hypothetical protein